MTYTFGPANRFHPWEVMLDIAAPSPYHGHREATSSPKAIWAKSPGRPGPVSKNWRAAHGLDSFVSAGLFEVVWAYYMKQSSGFTRLWPSVVTIVTMIISFLLLSLAMRNLPLGTAYTVWTGVGAVGAFTVGVAALGEPADATRIVAAVLIVCGLVLMRLSSTQ